MKSSTIKFIVMTAKVIAITMATLVVAIVAAMVGLPLLVLAAALKLIEYFRGNDNKSKDGDCRDMREEAISEYRSSADN